MRIALFLTSTWLGACTFTAGLAALSVEAHAAEAHAAEAHAAEAPPAATPPAEASLPSVAEVDGLIDQGQAFLLAKAQADGSFMAGDKFKLGITQLAAEALATEPKAIATTHPALVGALRFQLNFIQADGGVYGKDGNANYCTSLALLLWTAAKSGTPEQIGAAQRFLFAIQNKEPASVNQGGIGYGSKGLGHEDLSNTSYAIAALRASGIASTDPHLQAALKFLEKCQDLSAVNPLPWAQNSGGGVYAPDESKAGGSWTGGSVTDAESAAKARLVPYGGMSYALISSYLALDLKADDPRVAAALGWVKSNYQFEVNPGMPATTDANGNRKDQQGLFYYYTVMAKTFDLLDQGPMTVAGGKTVDWRSDLFATIRAKAKADADSKGVFWLNDADRWGEGLPQLVTAYTVKALKRIRASL